MTNATQITVPSFTPADRAALECFKAGLQDAWKNKKLIVGVFLLNALWTVLWSGPLSWVLSAHLAHRPAGVALADRWNLEIIGELLMEHPELLSLALGLLFYGLLSYALVTTFVIGGVLSVPLAENLRRGQTPHRAAFGGAALRNFPTLLTVALVYLIPLLIIAVLLLVSLSLGLQITRGWSPAARLAVATLCAVPALAGLVLWDGALDFSRIRMVFFPHTAERRGAPAAGRLGTRLRFVWRCLSSGPRILAQRGMSAVWLHLGYLLAGMVLALCALLLPFLLDWGGWTTWVAVGVTQLFVLLRIGVRVGALCGQTRYLVAVPPPAQPEAHDAPAHHKTHDAPAHHEPPKAPPARHEAQEDKKENAP
jgi:hypothetical protein